LMQQPVQPAKQAIILMVQLTSSRNSMHLLSQ
jgi:hypothetical protein